MRHGSGWEGAEAVWDLPADPREYDALAELFLDEAPPNGRAVAGAHTNAATETSDEPAPAPDAPTRQADALPAPPATTIEGLIVGNLPAMPGAWVMQHARALVEELGAPVCVVRCAGGLVSVELVGAPTLEIEACATLDAAIGAAASTSGRFLLRVDPGEEHELASAPGVSGVTLLTGADEPAVIAAYAALKSLFGAPGERGWPAPVGRESGRAPKACRLVFVGADALRARDAGEKLCRAAAAFLSRPLSWSMGPDRIAPAPTSLLFRGRSGASVRAILAAISAAALAARAARDESATEPRAEAPPPPAPVPVEDASVGHAPPPPDAHHVVEAAPRRDAEKPDPALPLRMLPFDCPDAPGALLGLDAAGVLHAVAEGGAERVGLLLAARAWAERHRAVLRLACGALDGAAFDAGAPARMVLITDDAGACETLLRTEVRVRIRAGAGSVAVNAGG